MLSIRKTIILVLAILTALFLASCTAETESYINDYDVHENGIEVNDSTPLDIVHTAFTGDPDQAYNFLWQEGRYREWEEDIIFYAETILENYPFFVDFDSFRVTGEAGRVHHLFPTNVDYTGFIFDTLLQRAAARNGIFEYERESMTKALRELFIDKINTLINDIPNLDDFEIRYRLSEVAAILCDIHTEIDLREGSVFPVHVLSLYNGIYLVSVPKEIEFALYSKLLSINDICIDEIIERFRAIVPHENEYRRHGSIQQLLMTKELLYFMNIVDDSGNAYFTIMDTSGEIFDVQLQAISQYEFQNMSDAELARHDFYTSFKHSRTGDRLCLITSRQLEGSIDGYYFWHEFFQDYNILYVRSVHFRGDNDTFEAKQYLNQKLRDWPYDNKIDKLIIDIRQNGGGVLDWPSIFYFPFLSQRVSSFYVLIDGRSLSRSVLVAANLRNHMESDVTIIGEPAGQPENFFTGAMRAMPNSGLLFSFSTTLRAHSNSEDTVFRPDIFIPLTIDDIINNHDPLLEFIKK